MHVERIGDYYYAVRGFFPPQYFVEFHGATGTSFSKLPFIAKGFATESEAAEICDVIRKRKNNERNHVRKAASQSQTQIVTNPQSGPSMGDNIKNAGGRQGR